jgi:hypothetical protein
MESAVKQIHAKLLGLMTIDDHASTSILKKYLRAYTENELEKQHLAKELCTSKDMEMLSKKITDKFGTSFKTNNVFFKRANKKFIFGISLPRDLAVAEAKFKSAYLAHFQQSINSRKRQPKS